MKREDTEEQATELYLDETAWLPPVDTMSELPTGDVRNGAFVFVQTEGAVYQYTAERGWFCPKNQTGAS